MSIELVEDGCINKAKIIKPGRDVRIYVDTERIIEDGKFQIYLQQEPEAIRPIQQHLLKYGGKYNAILTFDTKVLEKWNHAKLFTLYTETWLQEKDYMNIDLSKKQYKISCLVGGKRITVGHEIRLSMYFHQEFFQMFPFTFYRSCAHPLLPEITKNPFLESKECSAKHELFTTFQFHLAIENSRQDNYFTEKLVDCLISKTIPIYYGCPNIGSYFDTSGWIVLEQGTPDELVQKCSMLSPNYYNEYTQTIESNYKRALYIKENFQRLNECLATIPGYL